MSEKTKAGIAFLVIGVLAFAIGSLVLNSMKSDVLAVINALPANDPSLGTLNKVIEKIGYAGTLMTITPTFLFGVGFAWVRTGIKQQKN